MGVQIAASDKARRTTKLNVNPVNYLLSMTGMQNAEFFKSQILQLIGYIHNDLIWRIQ